MICNGVDLTRLSRIENSLKNPRFLTRVFGPEEIQEYHRQKENPLFLAGNYSAKEAFAKALGTGVRKFQLSEVEVLRDALGAPYFVFSGKAKELIIQKKLSFTVSISHEDDLVIAMVVGWRQELEVQGGISCSL